MLDGNEANPEACRKSWNDVTPEWLGSPTHKSMIQKIFASARRHYGGQTAETCHRARIALATARPEADLVPGLSAALMRRQI